VLLACGCVSQGNDYPAPDSGLPVSGTDLMPLDVVINIASGNSTQTFYSTAKTGSSAFDALDKIAEVEATDGEYGKFITSINGASQDESHYWMFFVNGKLASVGSSSYVLESGDEIEFKLMDSQEAGALMGY